MLNLVGLYEDSLRKCVCGIVMCCDLKVRLIEFCLMIEWM